MEIRKAPHTRDEVSQTRILIFESIKEGEPMYEVKADDFSEFTLMENDLVSSVLQNVAIILSTLQGDVPFGREIGLAGKFIDKPMVLARTMMIAEIQDALLLNEPRATLKGVIFDEDVNAPGRLIPIVTVEVNDGQGL